MRKDVNTSLGFLYPRSQGRGKWGVYILTPDPLGDYATPGECNSLACQCDPGWREGFK